MAFSQYRLRCGWRAALLKNARRGGRRSRGRFRGPPPPRPTRSGSSASPGGPNPPAAHRRRPGCGRSGRERTCPDIRTWGGRSGPLRWPSPVPRDLRHTRCGPGCRRRPAHRRRHIPTACRSHPSCSAIGPFWRRPKASRMISARCANPRGQEREATHRWRISCCRSVMTTLAAFPA